jgi:glycosyltransferase involved in cell wall biosynthesis
MRIAIIAQEYPPETAKGGIGAQALMKAQGLAARGHEVYVISRAIDGRRSERMDGPVHLIRIPGFEGRMPVYTEVADWLTYSAEVSVAIAALHAQQPLDLVEIPEWAAEGYVHFLNRTEWNYIPTVLHIHGPLAMFAHTMDWPPLASDFYRVGSEMEAFCLRAADAVYSSSAYSADWCVRHYGLDKSRIPVLHTGVDVDHFSPRPIPRDARPTVAFVGKMVRNKGVVRLTEAACRLAREIPGLRLLMMGRGEEPVLREMRALADAASCPDLLDLRGFVPREELPGHLSRCQVFAAPATFEGGPGFTCLEAMACGLPVIACAGNGVAEVVVPETNGLLIPPDDVGALCDALRRLLLNGNERERLGRNARDYVLAHADSRTCMDRLEAYYQSLVSARTKRDIP